ncbi:MAG TPA: hypothetical protein RMH80_02670, partial [Polyangiaceae bacterium LLY-WYZ-15_(1-7)]|nr:hypothetical protein [Polyangiaceae bacterium LLY-WYZ-15_(1-7)]
PRRRPRLLRGVLLFLLTLLALVWLFRSAIATAVAERALERRGVRCEALALELAPTLGSATLAPGRCTLPSERILSVAFPEGATATLGLDGVQRVEAPVVELERGRRIPLEGLGAALLAGGPVPEKLRRAVDGLARASGEELPAIEVGRLVLTSPERAPVAIEGVRARRTESGLRLEAEGLALPPTERPGLRLEVALGELVAEASAAEVSIGATATLDFRGSARLLSRFGGARTVGLRLEGEALDTEDPRYALELDGPILPRVRRLLEGLRDALEERRGDLEEGREERRQERRDALEERLDERRETRGGGRRERLRERLR